MQQLCHIVEIENEIIQRTSLFHYLYVDANNLYWSATSKKLHTGNIQWIEDSSIFTEVYIKNYDENSDTGYLSVVDVAYPKDLYEKHKYLPFYLRKSNLIKVVSYHVTLIIKTIILYTYAH